MITSIAEGPHIWELNVCLRLTKECQSEERQTLDKNQNHALKVFWLKILSCALLCEPFNFINKS